jgi:hypothetical protein
MYMYAIDYNYVEFICYDHIVQSIFYYIIIKFNIYFYIYDFTKRINDNLYDQQFDCIVSTSNLPGTFDHIYD